MFAWNFGFIFGTLKIMKFEILVGLIALSASVVCPETAMAHGGGAPHDEVKASPEPPRIVPKAPRPLSESVLKKVLNSQGLPKDVLVVRCMLGQFATCRGLEIGLYTESGVRLSSALSGTGGVVGFEGLSEGSRFMAQIEGSKYQGITEGISPGILTITGDRK